MLPWDREDHRKEYERIFQCPVEFNAGRISLELKKEHVEQPILSSDYQLLRILVEYAERKQRAQQASIQAKVEQSVLNLLKPEFPGIIEVASHLNMSSRSLQRKLKLEGSSYSSVIEKIKRDLAMDYLERDDLSISEIAYLLDYAEASSFIRSFKRWTGLTPNAFRSEKESKIVS